MALADLGHRGERVRDAGAGLAVDQHDVADRRLSDQPCFERSGRDWLVLGEGQHAAAPAHHLRELARALAVSAVVEHQHMAVPGHDGGHRSLDAEGAAALQGHDDMAVLSVNDRQQAAANAGGHSDEVRVP